MDFISGYRAYTLAKKYADKVGAKVAKDGFKVQVEEDRSILETTGQEKVFYFLPKTSSDPQDGYDEYIYANGAWEQVGVTDIDLSDAEELSNKVTSISAQSTDDEYPTAKCIYDIFGDISTSVKAENEENTAE